MKFRIYSNIRRFITVLISLEGMDKYLNCCRLCSMFKIIFSEDRSTKLQYLKLEQIRAEYLCTSSMKEFIVPNCISVCKAQFMFETNLCSSIFILPSKGEETVCETRWLYCHLSPFILFTNYSARGNNCTWFVANFEFSEKYIFNLM